MQDGVPTSQMHYSTKELRASAVCFHQTRELQQFPSAFRPTGPILAVCTELFFISRSSEAISYQATQSAPFPPKGFISPLTINRLLAVRKEGRSGLLKCLLKGENRHNKRWRQVLKNISRHQFTKYVTKSFPAVPWQISPGYYFFFLLTLTQAEVLWGGGCRKVSFSNSHIWQVRFLLSQVISGDWSVPKLLDLAKMKNLEVQMTLPSVTPEFVMQLCRVKSMSSNRL